MRKERDKERRWGSVAASKIEGRKPRKERKEGRKGRKEMKEGKK